MAVVSAADLGVPEIFNAAQFFLDRHIEEGRGHKVAIEVRRGTDDHARRAAGSTPTASAARWSMSVACGQKSA